MNVTYLKGNLGRDPELRYTATGKAVVSISVATSRSYKKQDGTWEEETTFVKCEAWDTAAENIANNFKKGDGIFIDGTLKEEKWEKDGQKHYSMKVRINSFAKLERTRRADANSKAKVAVAAAATDVEEAQGEDDIPF